jgi:hypothetical protein
VNRAALQVVALEVRSVVSAVRDELRRRPGSLVISGMLAEQLARQLSGGAETGAVTVGDASRLDGRGVVVHVLAGDPAPADDELVRAADRAGVPVVLVQVWPQADWKPSFVFSPFVVECRAGEGFPLEEIAARIAEAYAEAPALAARIPSLRNAVAQSVVHRTVVRAGLIGGAGRRAGPSRALLALEQLRMIARLEATRGIDEQAVQRLAGLSVSTVTLSFLLRAIARRTRGALPQSVADAAVAAAGTWALGEAVSRLPAAGTRSA